MAVATSCHVVPVPAVGERLSTPRPTPSPLQRTDRSTVLPSASEVITSEQHDKRVRLRDSGDLASSCATVLRAANGCYDAVAGAVMCASRALATETPTTHYGREGRPVCVASPQGRCNRVRAKDSPISAGR